MSKMDLGARVTVNHRHYTDQCVELGISTEFYNPNLRSLSQVMTQMGELKDVCLNFCLTATSILVQPGSSKMEHNTDNDVIDQIIREKGKRIKQNIILPKFDEARHFVFWQDSGYIFLCFYSIVEFQAGFKKWLMKQELNVKTSFCHLP